MFPDGPPAQQRPWTLLLYAAADNDLDRYVPLLTQRLMAMPTSPSIHVVVLVDRRSGAEVFGGFCITPPKP